MPDPLSSSCPTVSLSCPTPIGHLTFPLVMPDSDRASLPLQIAGQAGNDDMVPCTSFSSVMPDRLIVMLDTDRASLPLQIAGQAGNDDIVPCPFLFSVMPDPLSSSCPTPIGHLFPSRLPVKPAMTIWYHALPPLSSCSTFSSLSCPTISLSCPTPIGHLTFPLVMPDSDRASQIAGQAGNDDMVPCTSSSLVMPDPLSSSCPTPIGHLTFLLVMPNHDRAS